MNPKLKKILPPDYLIPIMALALQYGCSSACRPAELEDARGYLKSNLKALANKEVPHLWSRAKEALAEAEKYAKKGKAQDAKLWAMKAQVRFKIAIANGQILRATRQLEEMEKVIEKLKSQRERYRSRRLRSEKRYMEIMKFHMKNKDAALIVKKNYENERRNYLKLNNSERERWNELKLGELTRDYNLAVSYFEAGKLIGRKWKMLSAQHDELNRVVQEASEGLAGGEEWIELKPLISEAVLMAQNFLFMQRQLSANDVLKNPAEDEELRLKIESEMKNVDVFISSAFIGMIISFKEIWRKNQNEFKEEAVEGIIHLCKILKASPSPLIGIEAYYWSEKTDNKTVSEKIARKALETLSDCGFPKNSTFHLGLGNISPVLTGPCVKKQCEEGRLDFIIINY